MVTFKEAAGENTQFMANAIAEITAMAGFCAGFLRTRRSSQPDRGIGYPERNRPTR
jgi:hypothetical protein